jgi:hypothetical protein
MSETTATRPPRQRKKPERHCRLTRAQDGTRTLTLRIGQQTDTYDLLEIATDYGRGFEVTKADGTVYHVCLDGLASGCDCKGFSRWSHCKHVDSLAALQRHGTL